MRIYLAILMITWCHVLVAQNLEIEKIREKMTCSHPGIRRCVRYDITSDQIGKEMDGLKIAFITDIHYESRFDAKALKSLGAMLRELNADVLLMGGDYQEGCEYVEPLFKEVMTSAPQWAYGVLGNNDYERCTDMIKQSMSDNGIKLLEGTLDTIAIGESRLIIAGAENTFGAKESKPSPTLGLDERDFVILLTHTPDYAEDVSIKNTDIALAGHLHGGQVTMFGLFAPVMPSHYGQKFRHGINYNTDGIPVLTSNGIGTSRMDIRFCAAAEIHLIVLHSKNNKNNIQ